MLISDLFWKDFSQGTKLSGMLVIAQASSHAFKKLATKYSHQYPHMPATVPVHEKFVYHNGVEWVLTDDERDAFPVFVVDPSMRNEK